MTRLVQFVLFPEFQILDAAGPIAAFEIAARFAPRAYAIKLTAPLPGPVASSSGAALTADKLGALARTDTLIVIGGDGSRRAQSDPALITFVRRAARCVRRLASVCSGAFVLGAAGALDGRRATTHWSRAHALQTLYPAIAVEPDRLWVRDGHVWTSAGITAGIDLALAMIAEDLGPDIARDTARQLVMWAPRTGGQTQHSRMLDLCAPGERFAALHTWIREHLDLRLDVAALAAKAGMSARTFARAYVQETGVTPAKAVERLRLEAARTLLEDGAPSLERIARQTGFRDGERMRRAFVRLYGAPPSSVRRVRPQTYVGS